MPSGESSRKSGKLSPLLKWQIYMKVYPYILRIINECSEEKMCLKACANDIQSVHSPVRWHP